MKNSSALSQTSAALDDFSSVKAAALHQREPTPRQNKGPDTETNSENVLVQREAKLRDEESCSREMSKAKPTSFL